VYSAPQSPRSIGGVMDDAIDLLKASFRASWMLTAAYALVAGAIGVFLQWKLLPASPLGVGSTQRVAAALAAYANPLIWLSYLGSIFVSTWFTLALVRTQIEVARGNTAVSGFAQLGTVLRFVPGALFGTLLMSIAVICGMILLFIPGLFLIIRWVIVSPALVDRQQGIFDAMGTSWSYVRGNWWRTATIVTVVAIVVIIVAAVFAMIFGYVAVALRLDRATLLIGGQLVSAVSQVLYWPAMVATLVAIYQDLKLRKEGGDIEARLSSLGSARA